MRDPEPSLADNRAFGHALGNWLGEMAAYASCVVVAGGTVAIFVFGIRWGNVLRQLVL